ncbi:hypothetical protein C8F01DRAFT_999211, partial [Mycena amicta]
MAISGWLFSPPTMTPELASEIWLEIANELYGRDVRMLSLTNRRIRELCKTLLFAHFDFRPYQLPESYGTQRRQPRLPDAAGVQRTRERLEFWSSDAIAPLVRTCKV